MAEYLCDAARHLVCVPYSVEGLHTMAEDLGIGRHWFHAHPTHAHYDVPQRRQVEIRARCTVVTTREILAVCLKGDLRGADGSLVERER